MKLKNLLISVGLCYIVLLDINFSFIKQYLFFFLSGKCWNTVYLNSICFRIMPAVAVLFFYQVTIARRLSSGPLWKNLFEEIRDQCLKNWLSTFFYYQNYMPDGTSVSTCIFTLDRFSICFIYFCTGCPVCIVRCFRWYSKENFHWFV